MNWTALRCIALALGVLVGATRQAPVAKARPFLATISSSPS